MLNVSIAGSFILLSSSPLGEFYRFSNLCTLSSFQDLAFMSKTTVNILAWVFAEVRFSSPYALGLGAWAPLSSAEAHVGGFRVTR